MEGLGECAGLTEPVSLMGTWDTSNDREFQGGEQVALTKEMRMAAKDNFRHHSRWAS